MVRNKIYYDLKPFIPRSWRMAVRRMLAGRQRARSRDLWPIMPGSERPPEGWPGWPAGKKFGLILTHDVEGRPGLEKCRQLMEMEMDLGFCSSFNFVPEGTYEVPAGLREELVRNGFEVGVHDLKHDGQLFRSFRKFERQADRVNHYLRQWNAVGFRSGFMLHNLDWLHRLEIEYDLSTFDTDPFEPQPEGCHTIFPFWVQPPVANRRSQIANPVRTKGYVEMPYTLPQDSTLFLLLREKTPAVWLRKLDWVVNHGGMALLDTHPDYMAFDASGLKSSEYPVEFYKELLEYIRTNYEGDYWNALPKQAAEHVLSRSLLPDPTTDSSPGRAPELTFS